MKRIRALFKHPELGMHHIVTNVESIEEFRKTLKEYGCTVAFVEEVKEDKN